MKLNYKPIFLIAPFILVSACTTSQPPRNIDNICTVLTENQDWFSSSLQTFQKWKVPISTQMAFIHQESRFVADAEGSSSAYGYAQVIDGTWENYLRANNKDADRDDFAAASDFIGWYIHESYTKLGIDKSNVYHHYLAYNQGQGGYKRRSYAKKKWLLKVADKVAKKARVYQQQLEKCSE